MGRQVCLITPSCPFIAAAKTSFCCASAAKVLLRRSSKDPDWAVCVDMTRV